MREIEAKSAELVKFQDQTTKVLTDLIRAEKYDIKSYVQETARNDICQLGEELKRFQDKAEETIISNITELYDTLTGEPLRQAGLIQFTVSEIAAMVSRVRVMEVMDEETREEILRLIHASVVIDTPSRRRNPALGEVWSGP